MVSRAVLFSVAETCTTSSGATVEHGTHSGTEEEVHDAHAPGGVRPPRFVIEDAEGMLLDVTELVENGDIIVVVP